MSSAFFLGEKQKFQKETAAEAASVHIYQTNPGLYPVMMLPLFMKSRVGVWKDREWQEFENSENSTTPNWDA